MYENPKRRTYTFNAITFAGNARYIQGPKGKRGRVVEVSVAPTTSFVGTTTPGIVTVDDGVTTGKFAAVNVGAASAGTAVGAVVVCDTYAAGLNSTPNTTPYVYCTADTPVKISFVAPTGGSPAGAADVFVTVDWD